jgi:hypothetical protein
LLHFHIISDQITASLSLSLSGYEIVREREQEREREREREGGQIKGSPPSPLKIVFPFAAFSYHI